MGPAVGGNLTLVLSVLGTAVWGYGDKLLGACGGAI